MRVVLLDNMLPPYRIPLYNKLVKYLGWDLEVYLCSKREKDRLWNIVLEGLCFKVKVLKGVYFLIKFPIFQSGIYHFHLNFGIICRLLKKDIDVFIISGYGSFTSQIAIWLAFLLRVPTVLWVRSFNKKGISQDNFSRRTINWWKSCVIRKANAYIAPGRKTFSYLKNLNIDPKFIRTIGNPIDNNLFNKINYSVKCYDKKKGEIVILFVGRLIAMKGINILLSAFSMIDDKNLTLLMIGDGPLRGEVEKAKRKDYRIKYIEFIPRNELVRYYRLADFFVLPSVYEPWGLVINEAMNSGLPIITTNDVGAAGEIVQDSVNGCVIEPNNISALTRKINELKDNRDKRVRMGQASKRIIQEWGVDKSIKGFKETSLIALEQHD